MGIDPTPLRISSRTRRRDDEDFRHEIEAHIALEADRLVEEGLRPIDARAVAGRKFGNITRVQERFYESRRIMWLDHLRQDVRYALRSFVRSPLFAISATLSLAIGIAADTTVFTVANGLLLRPPAGVAEPDRLVDISAERGEFGVNQISFPNYVDIRERVTTLDDVYAYEPFAEQMSLAGPGGAERVFGHRVTLNYFAVLGLGPSAGRLFGVGTERRDAAETVVLSHRFWSRRFHRDPAIIGQTLVLNAQPLTVVGIAAEGFQGTSVVATDVWVPLPMTAAPESFLTRRELGWALVRGRLKPGVSVAQAAAELDAIGRALEQEYPDENRGRGLRLAAASLVPGNLALPLAGILALILGFVSLVLAIACANLAGLLLARSGARRREIAVRVAVGAARMRLIGQLLTETMVLFILGAGAGLLLARGMTSLVVSLVPALPVPVDVSLALDGRVIAFTTGLSLAAAVLCGLAPALQASKLDVVSALKDTAQGLSSRLRLRNAFVIGQVALSLVLVVGAGVFVRALQKASSTDHGFDPRGVELAEIDLGIVGYTRTTGPPFIAGLVERVHGLPGVQHATMAAALPTDGARFGSLTHPGSSPSDRERVLEASWNVVEPGYFATLRIPLVAGRDFSAADRQGAQPVVIVSEQAAVRFWPGQDAIGKSLLQHPAVFLKGQATEVKTLQVIGVVRNVTRPASDSPRAQVYIPLQQHYVPRVTLIARTTNGQRLANAIREVVGSMDPHLPILSAQTLEEAASFALLPQRVAASVSGSLGVTGLFLAAIGIFGVTAYVVAQRTREIGVRMALGARRVDVVGMVLRQGMLLVGIGSAIGLVLALAAGWVLARVFFGFPPIDAVALGGAAALFGAVGLAACYVPARRATRVDPVAALRAE